MFVNSRERKVGERGIHLSICGVIHQLETQLLRIGNVRMSRDINIKNVMRQVPLANIRKGFYMETPALFDLWQKK